MIRTHEAGTLRTAHAGEKVVLSGWVARRRDHGGVVFIDLRDASGVVQVVWRGGEAPPQGAPTRGVPGGRPPDKHGRQASRREQTSPNLSG